jgi:hypothetical protein
MKKSSSAALLTCLVLLAVLPTWGCGNGTAIEVNKPLPSGVWDKPADISKIVDSQVSWRKFVAEAKQLDRMKAAEKQFQEPRAATASIKIVFMKDEIEYVIFGDKSPYKGIDPERLYEVGVITLAAKEDWGGAEGYQIREYKLKFITPRRDGDWKFISGTYYVKKYSGSLAVDPSEMQFLREEEYLDGYLRPLFVKPLAAKSAAAGPVGQGGEQPVETKIQP